MVYISKTMRYLKRNGVKTTYYAVLERLIAKDAPLKSEDYGSDSFEGPIDESIGFSILVPVYETHEKHLREMIESVLGQVYGNFELILADASKSDNPRKIIESYKDARIKYVPVKENKGISENTNVAIEAATMEYCALLDHDDLLTPDALYEMAMAISKGRKDGLKVNMVYSDEDKCNGDATKFFGRHTKQKLNLDLLMSNNYICHFTVIESSLIKELRFRGEYNGSQDYDMFLRVVNKSVPVAGANGSNDVVDRVAGKADAAKGNAVEGVANDVARKTDVANGNVAEGVVEGAADDVAGKTDAANGNAVEGTADGVMNGQNVNKNGVILYINKVLYHWRCHEESTAFNPASKEYAYISGKKAIADFVKNRYGSEYEVYELSHKGFYGVNWGDDIFAARPDVGAIGGRVAHGNKITSGIINSDEIERFVKLNRNFSGYFHRAHLQHDIFAADIRTVTPAPSMKVSFDLYMERYVEYLKKLLGIEENEKNPSGECAENEKKPLCGCTENEKNLSDYKGQSSCQDFCSSLNQDCWRTYYKKLSRNQREKADGYAKLLGYDFGKEVNDKGLLFLYDPKILDL